MVIGEVFDDGTAQPLDGVEVARIGGAPDTVTHTDGRYSVVAPAGDAMVTLQKTGYTRGMRTVSVSPGGTTAARNVRLTALAAPTLVGQAGGVVTVTYRSPAIDISKNPGPTHIELHIPPESVPDGTVIRLTPLSPQGLIAPLPVGWSVLRGVDLQASPGPRTATTLRVPLMFLASMPMVTAIWDQHTQQWRVGPAASADGDTLAIGLVGTDSDLSAWGSQLAVLVADAAPAAPELANPGEALRAPLLLPRPASDSGAVLANPAVVVAGGDATASVVTSIHALDAVSSGSVFETQLHEHYVVRGGAQLDGLSTRQELIGYQMSEGSLTDGTGTTLGAYFTVKPSHPYRLEELQQGRVTIDLFPSQSAGALGAASPTGGEIGTPTGPYLAVPAGAVDRETGIAVRLPSADELPSGIAARPDFLCALHLDVFGSTLSPDGLYELACGALLPDADRFIVARFVEIGGRMLLDVVALAEQQDRQVRFNPCADGRCYEGWGSGTYVVLRLDGAAARVTGVVRDRTDSRQGIAVESNTIAVASLSDSGGRYLIPAPIGRPSTLTAREPIHNLTASVSVTPETAGLETRDLLLQGTRPKITQIQPSNHAAQVAAESRILATFSQPMDRTSLLAAGAVSLKQVGATAASTTLTEAVVSGHVSVSTDAQQVVFAPSAPLETNSVYRFRLAGSIIDQNGTPLASPSSPGDGQGDATFMSDFTTASVFHAAALPPNSLRVSLPDDSGKVLVCGGAQLAAPGTVVVVTDTATGVTATSMATDDSGVSSADCLDRCDTTAPGAFCTILSAAIGERIQVQVEDVLHNTATLDAGNMRDEISGTTVIDTEGGTVFAAADPRYHVAVPKGAFESATLVTLTPATADELPTTAGATMELVGGIRLDFGDAVPATQVDISVPAPVDAGTEDQYLATQVVNFRGIDELTAVDTAFWDATNGLITTDPAVFAGVRFAGLYGVMRSRQCTAYVTGFATLGQHYSRAFIPGDMFLPFPILQTLTTRWVVPVPCDRPVQLTLAGLDGEQIDFLSLSTMPAKGQFVFTCLAQDPDCRTLSDDRTPPRVIAAQVSVPDQARNVGHDVEISVPFSEAILTASIDGHVQVICRRGDMDVEMRGTWSQSADGKRLFFVPLASQPLHGLPFGTECELRVDGVKDRMGNVLDSAFTSGFATFAPVVLQHAANIDAVAVDSIGWHQVASIDNGQPLLKQFIALAEGDTYRPDFAGGIVIQEISEQQATAAQLTRTTEGFDYAVHFLPPEDVADSTGTVFHGPYLMSLDGPGTRQSRSRFGVWHLYDLSAFPTITPVVSRLINQSSDSLDRFNTLDPAADPTMFHFLEQIPNDLGLPLSVADLGVAHAYIANAPNIGIEQIQVAGIDRGSTTQGVDGIGHGHFRSVATLYPWVLGGRPDGLIVTDAELQRMPSVPDYPLNGTQLSVLTLAGWPVDRDRDGTITANERFDLVVAGCQDGDRAALCVVAFDTASGTFQPGTLSGVIRLPSGSLPFRAVADPERRLLYLANGTIGLTVIDFQDPSGTLDDSPRDGTDDRVLANVPLPTEDGRLAAARDVAMDIDPHGHVIAYVAAREDGWFTVDLGPARMSSRLLTYAQQDDSPNLVEATQVRYFNEKRTTLYQPEVQLPGHLADLYPEEVTVTVEALKRGTVISALGTNFAPPSANVVLHRVPQTNRYTMARTSDGGFEHVLVVSNLPLLEDNGGGLTALMQEKFPALAFDAVYGGLGTMLRLTANVLGPDLQGRVREIPVEKVQVILVGIDGLRQDVLYPPEENSVQEVGANGSVENYHLDPANLEGIGQLFGGRLACSDPTAACALKGDLEQHQYRFPGETAIFPSITLASWASIFTSALPRDTGMLGNEFFARDVNGPVPSEPPAGVDAPGLLTFSDGAFWRDPAKDNLALVPFSGDWRDSPQNVALRTGVQTVFEQSEPILRASGQFAPDQASMVANLQHYARGLEEPNSWLTLPHNVSALVRLAMLLQMGSRGEAIALDSAALIDATLYLDSHLTNDGTRNDTPFPGLFVLYLPGLDHDAHGEGHGLLGGTYKDYIVSYTDAVLRQFVKKLHDLDEFYNKLIVLTADHGHTDMGEVPADLAQCGDLRKELGALDARQPGGENAARVARKRERNGNANLNIWELAALFNAINLKIPASSPALQFKLGLLAPAQVQLLPDTDVATSADVANVIAALNGPFAHFYVKNFETLNFMDAPASIRNGAPAEVAMLAEFLRVALTSPSAAGFMGLTDDDLAGIAKQAGRMANSVDFILYRDAGDYRVFNGLDPVTGAIQSQALEEFFAASGERFVFPVERIRNMNDAQRSGDVVVHFRFDSSLAIGDRYTAGVSCRAWHGGLGRSDSFVPLILSYPGGSRAEFLRWWNATGRSAVCDENRNLDCLGNWLTADLLRELAMEIYQNPLGGE